MMIVIPILKLFILGFKILGKMIRVIVVMITIMIKSIRSNYKTSSDKEQTSTAVEEKSPPYI